MSRVLVVIALVGCSQPRAFPCNPEGGTAECFLGNLQGRCEANGYCSFPDFECTTGSRYGEHAPAGVRGVCVENPPNDACEMAPLLVEGAPITGSLRGAGSTGILTCSPQAEGDVFYAIELAECSNVTLRAEASGGNLGIGLVRGCSELLGCSDAFQTTTPESLEVVGVPAGSYQVGIGGVGYDDEVTMTMAVAPPPTNDTLDTALAITSPAPRLQSFARSDDDLHVCNGTRIGGRDLFYSLSLPADSNPNPPDYIWNVDVEAVAEPLADLAVALLRDGAELACKPGGAGLTQFRGVVAGDYTLAVDGPTTGDCGRFDLAVATTRVQSNDECTAATPVTMSPAITQVDGDLRDASNDYIGTCGGTGNDLVYKFSLVRRSRVEIKVEEVSGGFTPFAYLRKVNGDDPSCATAPEVTWRMPGTCDATSPFDDVPTGSATGVGCAHHPALAQLDVLELDAGDYQIVVDSEDGAGAFRLTTRLLFPLGDSPGPILAPGTDCLSTGCCEIGSTVGATSSTLACGSSGTSDVYRTIPLLGCDVVPITIDVVADTPHRVGITTPTCSLYTTACGSPPVLEADNLYHSTITASVNSDSAGCAIQVFVTVPDDETGYFAVRVRDNATTVCP